MKTRLKITVASSIILLLFLLITDPGKLPSVLLVVPFLLLFITIVSFIPIALSAYQLPRHKMIKVSVVVAIVPVLLLVLQSLGQLTVRDVLAVVVLFSVVYFYTSRFGLQLTN